MKKNHALRGFVITGVIGFLLTGLLLVIGTLLADSLPVGAAWFQTFEGYYTVFENLGNADLWSISVTGEQLISNIIWFALIGVFGLFLIVSFIVVCAKKKPRLLWGVLLNLVFSVGVLFTFLGLYSAEYLGTAGTGGVYESIVELVTFKNADLGNTWWHNVVLLGLFVSLIILVVGIVGIFAAVLYNTKKVVEVEEVVEETPAEEPVVEEEPVEEPVQEKKKGILVLKRFDKFGETGPVVDRGNVDYPHEHVTAKPLTADEIREVIRDELKRKETERLCEELKEKRNAEAIAEQVIRAQEQREEKLQTKNVEEVATVATVEEKTEEKITPSPIIFAVPQSVKEEMVKEEKVEPVKKSVEPKKKALTEEQVKTIIADEIKSALKDLLLVKETIVEKPVEVVKKVEPKPVEAKPLVAETPVVEEPAPVAEEPAPVVEEVPEVPAEPKPKIIRIPFKTRMEAADDELKSAYNELKSLLKSYGLNNRVANGGDSFRLHRVTYCKITVAGKSLKLYLALNPEDYKDSTYPIKDASSKAIYKETPLVFKVKSGLSLRRGFELIRDCMDKHGLEQIDQIQLKDWVSELANEAVDEGEEEE